MVIFKLCSKCGVQKDYSEFYWRKDSNSPSSRCKSCLLEASAQVNARKRAEKAKLLKKISWRQKRWGVEPRVKTCNKCNTTKSLGEFKTRSDTLSGLRNECRDCSRIRHTEWERKTWKTRYKTNPVFHLRHALRQRFKSAIKRSYVKGSAVRDLCCSIPELKDWIELQFTDGMTWDNYGDYWHIDHILPLSHFDLNDPDQRRKACHWFNLRPLEAGENLKKSNKVEDLYASENFNKINRLG